MCVCARVRVCDPETETLVVLPSAEEAERGDSTIYVCGWGLLSV